MSPHPPPLVLIACVLSSCHEGVPFDTASDAAADAPAQPADGPVNGGDDALFAADLGGADQTSSGPAAQACPAAQPSEMCVFGSARCGGTEWIPLNTDQNCGRCGRTC